MKETRLQFALRHKDWTIEDWKNVIWTDETSVVLGQRQGKALGLAASLAILFFNLHTAKIEKVFRVYVLGLF